jgi:NDP-sugar pyrophosphorylase family protein
MLLIAEVPLIAHILSGLHLAGIREFVVVTGYLGEQIESFCERFARDNAMKITTVRQRSLDGTGGALMAAAPFIKDEDHFVLGWGDVLMDTANYGRFVERAHAEDYDLLLAVNRMRDPYRGAAVYLDEQMRVIRIVEKPLQGTSTTNWNNAGLFATTPRLLDYVRRLTPSPRGELELPMAIAAMIDDGLAVRAIDVRGFWSDVGTPEDLARVRKTFKPRGAK